MQDVFKRIKTHNEFLTLVTRMSDQQEGCLVPKKSHQYYEWMDRNETRLKKEIPGMMEELRRHFRI